MARHLLGIEDLSPEQIVGYLDAAERWFEFNRSGDRKASVLRGKTIINLFYEASTRTRTSFEAAGKRLSADVINVSSSGSSVTKGETLRDTARNLQAMRPDVIVLRHQVSGAPHYLARHLHCSIVNAGDGLHEHPTQGLLDAFTIRRMKGKIAGLTVAVIGDVQHSRVARSDAHLLRKLGAHVRFCAPWTLMPKGAEALGVEVVTNLDAALEGADVVIMLRIQRERLVDAMLPSTREYSRTFGLSQRTLARAKKDAIVMHPGPMNRGVEIDDAVADGIQSAVLDQVEAGVAVRMAVLESVAAG
ncbi:MAG: aspartate carbamoyltransferase catalytic subunit [Deltaproteobacteria bacterium]|nr:aspartate carbamoyltransferase catalytic subunit [Deltaproteobacteria bacterium]